MGVKFRLLGDVELRIGDRVIDLGHGRQRCVLVALLMDIGHPLAIQVILDRVWGGDLPSSPKSTLYSYVSRLRQALGAVNGFEIVRTRGGYAVHGDAMTVDLFLYRDLIAKARRADDGERAIAGFDQALNLWRGDPFASLESPWLNALRDTLLTEKLTAVLDRIDLQLSAGRHDQLLAELEALCVAHPLDERIASQRMIALYGCGRQAEALEHYRRTRRMLADELGIEPGTHLQAVHRQILAADPTIPVAASAAPTASPRTTSGQAAYPLPAQSGPLEANTPELSDLRRHSGRNPAPDDRARRTVMALFQLPRDVDDFTGRDEALSQLWEATQQAAAERASVGVVAAIVGKAGVGKTTLAIHAAHQLRSRFPDGQLFVDLRGAGPDSLHPGEVLGGFLRAFGIPGNAIPEHLEDRIRLYRATTANRRLIVLADNAASEAQVRPLLPTGAGSVVLVTSRSRLAGLESAHWVALDVLEPAPAEELLCKLVGRDRVAAEPEMAATLVQLCGQLPLAIRIAGARLAAKRHWSLARLARRLADERRRLDELTVGDLEVRAAFTLTYRGQPEPERRAFRLLGLVASSDFPAWVVAALLDQSVREAEDLVERLVDVQLIEAIGEDTTGCTRYRLHDLLRIFAAERAKDDEPQTSGRAALENLLSTWLALAEKADAELKKWDVPLAPRQQSTADPGVLDNHLVDSLMRAPLDWFETERENLVSAVQLAYDAGFWGLTWRLAGSLAGYLRQRAHWADWCHAYDLAIQAASRAGDRSAEAYALLGLGDAYWDQGRSDAAADRFERCLAAFRELDDRRGEAIALLKLGRLSATEGRIDRALMQFDRSLELFREIDDRAGHAHTLLDRAEAYRYACRVNAAMASFDQCLHEFRELGDLHGAARTLFGLGDLHRYAGRFNEAMDTLNQCLNAFRGLGDQRGAAVAMCSIAVVYQRQGRFDDAIEYLDQSLQVFCTLGYHSCEAQTLRWYGDIHREQGRHGAAITCLERCLEIHRQIDDPLGEAEALLALGQVYREQDRYDDAMACFDQCLSVFRQVNDKLSEARTLQCLGEVYHAQGRYDEAITCFNECLPVFCELGDWLWEAKTRNSMAISRISN